MPNLSFPTILDTPQEREEHRNIALLRKDHSRRAERVRHLESLARESSEREERVRKEYLGSIDQQVANMGESIASALEAIDGKQYKEKLSLLQEVIVGRPAAGADESQAGAQTLCRAGLACADSKERHAELWKAGGLDQLLRAWQQLEAPDAAETEGEPGENGGARLAKLDCVFREMSAWLERFEERRQAAIAPRAEH